MRQIVLCTVLAVTVGCIAGCASLGGRQENMIAAAKALDRQSAEAFNKGDVDAWMAPCWNSPEFLCYPADAVEVRGWQANRDGAAKMFAAMPRGSAVQITEANNMAAGDVVVGWGKWRTTTPLADGKSMVQDGRYTNVVAKRDGKWVYILVHLSVPSTSP